MSKYQCNTCGERYIDPKADGSPAFHVCPPEIIEHATFEADGKQLTPEKRTPRENIRNENVKPGLIFQDGKYILQRVDPNDRVRILTETPDSIIIAEGKGRTLVPE